MPAVIPRRYRLSVDWYVRTISSALTTAAIAAQHDEASDEQTEEHHIIVFGEGCRLGRGRGSCC